ncbi:MAG: hypothetical protein A3E80_05535 [Chlamydiae bacterium RIFCSPHIGHO2_12_FULL_49_9]|nr:MAG: hypothetical protein A3E80_05535 [Chlamydiae bacterium RIFCSPHIGHO2_12_FULL_49_9]
MPKPVHLIELNNVPILKQLQLEEALLRSSDKNFCIINRGSARAVVMGISGQPENLLNLSRLKRDRIPVIRRFSGGGTVIVDQDTLFITFIFGKKELEVSPFPEPILRWSADLYASSWNIPEFHLRENDYCIERKKCGGNAQYIRKDRWLHHTSFLWDYQQSNMDYLLLPAKRPAYRENRDHKDFLCRLKDHASSSDELLSKLKTELVKRFYIQPFDLKNWEEGAHRKATHLIEL